ncbi:MAG: hypothetical protein RLZZ502_1205 [Pseudomonadota bacterium]|jgi:predicted Zn-dependent protease
MSWVVRLAIGGIMVLFSLFSYYGKSSVNPITGEKQRISISKEEEVAMGLQSAPGMAREFGGQHRDPRVNELVARIGRKMAATPIAQKGNYPYKFFALVDPRTVNAFALPGGPIFITEALLSRLETEGQLAAVLGHELGHVFLRHSAEHMAKAKLIQGVAGAAAVSGVDPTGGMVANNVANMVNLKYGREDELESDHWGVMLMVQAGYDPRAMIRVMEILEKASGGSRAPQYMSSHPSPADRAERLRAIIAKQFPNGVPGNLIK